MSSQALCDVTTLQLPSTQSYQRSFILFGTVWVTGVARVGVVYPAPAAILLTLAFQFGQIDIPPSPNRMPLDRLC